MMVEFNKFFSRNAGTTLLIPEKKRRGKLNSKTFRFFIFTFFVNNEKE